MAKSKANIQITGMKQLQRNLKLLPEKAQKRVIKSAVTKAATPVVKAAKKLVRLGTGLKPDGSQREHLRNTITKTRAKIYKGGTVLVVAGPKAKAAPHAFLVDLGTKPHLIKLTKPWKHLPAGFVIHHPGAKAQHFMDRASQAVGAQSQAAMEKGIAVGIEREAAKLASKK